MSPSAPDAANRDLLTFIAEHRFVVPEHAQALLAGTHEQARARLRTLARAGYLTEQRVFAGQAPTYRCTRLGLHAIASDLRPSRISVGFYQHEVGAAWLWLAARNGVFGRMREVLGERGLRSHDSRAQGSEQLFGVRLGGTGPGGRERLHYPDLLLVDERGRRIAIEYELTCKDSRRRERILSGYASDPRIDAVLYVVHKPQVARAISASAARLRISHLVHVQRVRPPATAPSAAPRATAIERRPARKALEAAR